MNDKVQKYNFKMIELVIKEVYFFVFFFFSSNLKANISRDLSYMHQINIEIVS